MRSQVIAISLLWVSVIALATPTAASAPAKDAKTPSAQVFVQGFYDWYVGQAKQSNPNLIDAALAGKRWPMSEAIQTALKADEVAQAKTPDDIVGIDFDPFLAAQDECWPYKTGKVTEMAGKTHVEVFGHCGKMHPDLPDVIAELEQHDGKWVFVNFIYPGDPGQPDGDLLKTLKELQDERDHPSPQSEQH